MLHQRITPEAYLTSAVVYHRQSDQVVGSITAKRSPLETYDPQSHEFYCKDCLDQGHATRLVWSSRSSVVVPERFRHYKHADATHVCTHPVRYQKIDALAARYNAQSLGNHLYVFDAELESEVVIEREDREVDQASRVAKTIEALIYDRGLRDGQKLRFGNRQRNFHDAVYDTSPADKLRLFQESLAAARAQRDFYAAIIFRPIGHRGIWKGYEDHNIIPGIVGKEVEFAGAQVKPSALLWCEDKAIYGKVRDMANRHGTRQSSALVAYGEAKLNFQASYDRARAITRGSDVARGIYTHFIIRSAEQVSPWDYETLTFEQAAEHQDKIQAEAQKRKSGLFKPQMGLAL